MSRRGSAGNVLAGLCSFFLPGLGQLLQGRLFAALGFFLLSIVLWLILLGGFVHLLPVPAFDALWLILLGWVVNLLAAFDAANWDG